MKNDIIKLNVGGTFFVTTRATLCADSDSMLARKFDEDCKFAPPETDQDGYFFLDRDPVYFKHILAYLRSSCQLLPEPPQNAAALVALKLEAECFGLSSLVGLISNQEQGSKKRILVRIVDEYEYSLRGATIEKHTEFNNKYRGYQIVSISSNNLGNWGGFETTVVYAVLEKI